MKTLKKENNIIRVKDNQVIEYMNQGYTYCPKSEWKQKNRNIVKEVSKEKK